MNTSDRLNLSDGGVDLWRVTLDRSRASIVSLFASLSNDEKARAGRFHFQRDREHFIAARGSLRMIICNYLGLVPENVRFSYNRFGKPRVAAEGCRLRFNVSHSGGVGVIAVTIDREVGVDVEFVDPDLDVLTVAQGAFSTFEVADLRSLPKSLRTQSFYERWTRKEACLKAMGDGLSSSPEQQFAVSSIIRESEISFGTSVDDKIIEWSLTSLRTDDDYRAALAVEGKIGTIRYCQLPEDSHLALTSASGPHLPISERAELFPFEC